MSATYVNARGNMVRPEIINDLPILHRFQTQIYEVDEDSGESHLTLEYSDQDGKWHRLKTSLTEGMYILSLLKGLQLDVGFPMAEDPRNESRPQDSLRFKGDQWVQSNSPVEPEKLHALGLMTLRWNSCELGLKILFAGVTRTTMLMAWAITQGMGDIAICDVVREVISKIPEDEPAREHVLHALEIYDINRINRNQLTHFLPSGSSDGLQFMRAKGPAYNPQPFPSSLADVRRVAEDLAKLSAYLAGLANWFAARTYKNYQHPPGPLPEKPPVPDKLWKPAPPSQPKRKSQPQASGE